MTVIDQQLHGYQQGHELLSSSVRLPKKDQDLIDRLSDVAGPLRPGESFAPYLTCYPLPSRSHYVVARTWQDFDAPRAGCVRTRSAIVPMPEWTGEIDIAALVAQLSQEGAQAPARRMLVEHASHVLSRVEAMHGVELLEAIFLEDRKPIVMFDAVDPEGITLRLLVAFWPSLRRAFAVTTFALSPRLVSGRSFDLIFAPGDAKSRFSEWAGRRIDGRKSATGRHRWSDQIAERVFGDAYPSLIRGDVLGDLSSGGDEADLRISLLWNELHGKLESSPNAALGLLDIANSRSTRNLAAIKRLEPDLAAAARSAAARLPPTDAWRFLYALIDKLREVRLQLSVAKMIRSAAIDLAERAPGEAIANIDVVSSGAGGDLLLGAIGDGLAQNLSADLSAAVAELPASDLLRLLLLSPSFAAATLPRYPIYASRITEVLEDASPETERDAKRHLLRWLVDDHHADAAVTLIKNLDRDELFAEVKLLANANGIAAVRLHRPLVDRAWKLDAVAELRDVVTEFPAGNGTDSLLLMLIAPTVQDLRWLVEAASLSDERRLDLLRRALGSMTESELRAVASGANAKAILTVLMRDPAGSFDLVGRLIGTAKLDAPVAVDTILRVLPYADRDQAQGLAWRALEILLPGGDHANRAAAIEALLSTVGADLDGAHAIRLGLSRNVPAGVVASNLAAFNRSQPAARARIMAAVGELAHVLVARGRLDYPEPAAADAAGLLWDSAKNNPSAFVRASSTLMPFLLRARNEPAGPLIAAAFPPVYRELRKANDAPDFLRFFLFVDWDKCKVARRDLVDAFMRSKWRATDIALAAARAGDAVRIFRRIAKQEGGSRAIADIERNLRLIPDPWRKDVKSAINTLRGGSIIDTIDY